MMIDVALWQSRLPPVTGPTRIPVQSSGSPTWKSQLDKKQMIMLRVLCFGIVVWACATPSASLAAEWEEIQSWVYQLTNYREGKLDHLKDTDFDLVVIDLARDGGSDYFTQAEIQQLKDSGKTVLAYFEIGAIEEYRPEWNLVPADLKAGAVDGWPDEQYVRFWDARWWPIVQSRIDQSIAAGFDGAYLDSADRLRRDTEFRYRRRGSSPTHGRSGGALFAVCKKEIAGLQDRAPELPGTLHLVLLGATNQRAVCEHD